MKKPKIKITLRRVDNPTQSLGKNHSPTYRLEKVTDAVFIEHHAGAGQGKKIVRVGDTIDEVLADHLTSKYEVTTLHPVAV